ncbi:HDAC7 family protein [Megaselia abdita]
MHVLKLEMARDSAVSRGDRMIVPSTLSLDINHHSNQPPQLNQHHPLLHHPQPQQSPPSQSGDFNQEILELKKEQEMQKQKLIFSFQEQQKQLERHHKMQLEHKYQYAVHHSHGVFQELREQQRIADEQQLQRERREREIVNNNNNSCQNNSPSSVKRKENCSANASPEVKQKLQSFLINKKQAASVNGLSSASSSPFRNRSGVVKSSSGESLPAGTVGSHPYKIPQPPMQQISVKYPDDFPLRKTDCNSTLNDSGPNSPPTQFPGGNRGSPTSAPIQEENEDVAQYQPGQRSSINDLTLFTSPSMPNISLGRPHLPHHSHTNLTMLTALRQQAAMAAAAAANSQPLIGSGPPTYYNPLPSPLFERHQAANVGGMIIQPSPTTPPQAHAATNIPSITSTPSGPVPVFGQPFTDAQVARHLIKRPLGRTQSAPLPLGHPSLVGTGQISIDQTHYEETEAERQAYEQQKHLALTKKIRETVLIRSGQITSRETPLKEETEGGEVMDLTNKKQPPKSISMQTTTSHSLTDIMNNHSNHNHEKLRDQDYLQKQREILFMQRAAVGLDSRNLSRPLSRTLSSPLVPQHQMPSDTGQAMSIHASPIMTSSSADNIPPINLSLSHQRKFIGLDNFRSQVLAASSLSSATSSSSTIASAVSPPLHLTTGLAYDNTMLKHACTCGNNSVHPEHSGRLQSVWARLSETDLASRCHRSRSRKATQEELQVVHTEKHALLYGSNPISRQKLDMNSMPSFVQMACGGVGVDLDTTWNDMHTAAAARMAAGCVIDLAFKCAKGEVRNGFAVVRPPGHHAEPNSPMGFCFFNSIAIAAKLLRQKMGNEINRILIVDWDVHHGNGTQQVFYDCDDVLYLSIHRHDDGNFFPGTGGPTECGTDRGLGFNVNISWSGGLEPPLGDAEYLAAFRTIVMPIAREYNPDIILVSAGFDAAAGHAAPLGGYMVSPACFGWMTKELMLLADGKVVLALEGGYDLPAICDSAQECVKALLGDDISALNDIELNRRPCQNAIDTLQKTIAIQASKWPCVRRLEHTVGLSAYQAFKIEREECETVTAMAGLSMQPLARNLSREDSEQPMDQDESK